MVRVLFLLQGNATLHLYPHFKPLLDFPGESESESESESE